MKENLEASAIVCAPRARAQGAAVLSKALTKHINRFAHSEALQYEQGLRRRLMSKLQVLADRGAGEQELLTEIERILVLERAA